MFDNVSLVQMRAHSSPYFTSGAFCRLPVILVMRGPRGRLPEIHADACNPAELPLVLRLRRELLSRRLGGAYRNASTATASCTTVPTGRRTGKAFGTCEGHSKPCTDYLNRIMLPPCRHPCWLPLATRQRGIALYGSTIRDHHGAPGACQHRNPSQLMGVRMFSIMERYNRARNETEKDHSMLLAPEEAVTEQAPSSFVEPKGVLTQRSSSSTSPTRQSLRWPIVRGSVPAEAQFATWEPPVQPDNPRALTVALIGLPNAGKSSLLNALLGVTVSAVSNKVNTTRSDFRGIMTKDNRQLVFIDAPGIIESHPKKIFCKELVNAAWRGYEDADLGILVVDTVKRPTQQIFNVVRAIAPKPSLARFGFQHSECNEVSSGTACSQTESSSAVDCLPSLDEMRKAGIAGRLRRRLANNGVHAELEDSQSIPIILCLNKVDLASHPKWIHARTREFESHGHFQRVFHVSAKYRRGTDSLLDHLFSETVPRPWSFPSEMRTSLSKIEQVEELVRTYLFCWFNKDVPYRVRQQTVGWTPQDDGSVVIEHELLVKTAQVAKMICGIRGRIVLQMRKNVIYRLERLWGHKVVLHIYVKVS